MASVKLSEKLRSGFDQHQVRRSINLSQSLARRLRGLIRAWVTLDVGTPRGYNLKNACQNCSHCASATYFSRWLPPLLINDAHRERDLETSRHFGKFGGGGCEVDAEGASSGPRRLLLASDKERRIYATRTYPR